MTKEFQQRYYYGNDVEMDKQKAAYWCQKAHNNGSKKAKTFWEENELYKYK